MKRILFYGWQTYEWEAIKNQIQEHLNDSYEAIFAAHDRTTLTAIVKAKEEKNPIMVIVTKRNVFTLNPKVANLIVDFAGDCADEIEVVHICLLHDNQGIEIGRHTETMYFIHDNDWQKVFAIINGRCN